MKVVCKKNTDSGYYSNITPEKVYDILPSSGSLIWNYKDIENDYTNGYHIILDDMNCKGFFLKEYFYSTEELRQRKLDQLIVLN